MDLELRIHRELFCISWISLCPSGLEVRTSTGPMMRYKIEVGNGFLIMDEVTSVSYIRSTTNINSSV